MKESKKIFKLAEKIRGVVSCLDNTYPLPELNELTSIAFDGDFNDVLPIAKFVLKNPDCVYIKYVGDNEIYFFKDENKAIKTLMKLLKKVEKLRDDEKDANYNE